MRMLRIVASIVVITASAGIANAGGDTAFTYQGRLLDAGEPANGLFDFEFGLWDAANGGNPIGVPQVLNNVPVSDGLFTAQVDFGADAFDNADRWLEISVDGVPLAPRQPITRAPYSIQTRGIFVDQDQNVGIGTTTPNYPLHVSTTAPIGMLAETDDGTLGYGVVGFTTATVGETYGVYGQSNSTSGRGVYGLAANASGETYGVYGQSNSLAGTGVYGLHANPGGTPPGILGETNSGSNGAVGVHGRINDTSPGGFSAAVRGENLGTAALGIGVWGSQDGSGWGVYGTTVGGQAVRGVVTATSGTTYGGFFQSASTSGRGLFGEATATSGINYGVYGQSASNSGTGVFGWANAETGGTTGVWGRSDSDSGSGVFGESTAPFGKAAFGVSGRSVAGSGRGVFGLAANNQTNAVTYGVYGQSLSTNGRGVFGWANEASGANQGVYGQTDSPSGYGVYSNGDYGGSGAKFFIQPHPYDPSKEIRFVCLEGNESGTYFRGSTQLVDGRAVIDVPEEFRLVTEADGLTVQVTAKGPNAGLWVETETLDQIVVRGNGNVQFNYFVNGVRRGFADLELIRENQSYVPEVRGVPYGTQYREAHRQILVENGILNPDFTPNEATTAMMDWTLRDPEPEELSRAASSAKGESR